MIRKCHWEPAIRIPIDQRCKQSSNNSTGHGGRGNCTANALNPGPEEAMPGSTEAIRNLYRNISVENYGSRYTVHALISSNSKRITIDIKDVLKDSRIQKFTVPIYLRRYTSLMYQNVLALV